jgi:hypothetical protein
VINLTEYAWAFAVFLVGVLGWFLRLWHSEHQKAVEALKVEAVSLRREAVMKEELVGKAAATDLSLKSIREDLRTLTAELSGNNIKLISAVHELHLQLKDSQAANNREIYAHFDKKLEALRRDMEGMRARNREMP